MALLLARIWTDWIAFPMMAVTLLGMIALGIGYLIKVVAPKYPKQ